MADVSLELLQSLIQRGLDESTEVRREQAGMRHEFGTFRGEQAGMRRQNGEMRSIALLLADQGRRLERKAGEVRDEVERMVKAMVKQGLMGRLGHFETMIEARLDALAPPIS